MTSSSSVIFSLAILFCFMSTGKSIECYNCSSNSHIDCSEKFDADNSKLKPVRCNVFEAMYCIKTTGIWDGEIGTKRFCSSRNHGNMCEYIKRIGDEREYRSCVYTCNSDGCNPGSMPHPSFTMTFLWTPFVLSLTIIAFFL